MNKLSVLLLLFSFGTAYTQNLLTNENAIISLTDGQSLTIQGNAANYGLVSNEGALRLSGNWTNIGEYSSVSGTFSLIGGNQNFTPGSWEYTNLTINSSSLTIPADIIISEKLDLMSGVVTLENDAFLLLEENAQLTGGNENSYINGIVFTRQQGDLLLPVGTEAEYLPVQLFNVESAEAIGVRAFSQPFEGILSDLLTISPNRYWQIFDNENFSADSIQLPVIGEDFIQNQENATLGFTPDEEDFISSLQNTTLEGDLFLGSIYSAGEIASGFYMIAAENGLPPISVINVVTSLEDGKHDFLRIENIEYYKNNTVEIFDRLGNKVFEIDKYDNNDRVFRGYANMGGRGKLTTGSYYYTIKLSARNRKSGFVYVKN